MELRKRYHGRRTDAWRLTPFGKVVVSMLSIGLLSIAFACSSIGRWCAEKVFQPYFSANGYGVDSVTDGVAVTVSQNDPGRSSQVYTIALQPCYALQTGAFESYENAFAHALALQARGGAGYIYETDGIYRVFASGYPAKGAATSVQKQLSEAGLESAVYALEGRQRKISFSGNREKLESYCACLDRILLLPERFYRLSLDFDKNYISTEECRAQLSILEDEIKGIQTELQAASQMNSVLDQGVMQLMEAILHEVDEALIKEQDSRAELGAAIKRISLQGALELSKIVQDL